MVLNESILAILLDFVVVKEVEFSMEEKVTMVKVGDKYSVNYFNHKKETFEYFLGKGLQGGGYTWEALVRAAIFDKESTALLTIEFDSEGDAFFAHTTDKRDANLIKRVVERLSRDLEYREICIEKATAAGAIE